MLDRSVPQEGAPPTPSEELADAVEAVLDRLREARPGLESRIDRAATILLHQLASPPRRRPIRVRTHGPDATILVASSSVGGVVYAVDVQSWRCSCPDAHRSGGPCKHSISAWVLAQVDHRRPQRSSERSCRVCNGRGWVTIGETIISEETGEAEEVYNVVRCSKCQPREEPYMTDDELLEWMAGARWRFATSMPKHPHDYSLREWNDEETFVRVCRTVWDKGYDRRYIGRRWRTLDVGERYYIWLHSRPEEYASVPLEVTELINRAVRHQRRLV